VPELAQTVAEFGLGEFGLTRCGFTSVDTRPEAGVAEYGPRYAYVTNDEELVLFVEEEEVAGQLNLEIEKGGTFKHTFRWQNRNGTPVDLTGATALLQVRKTASQAGVHVLSLASYAAPGGAPSPWYQDITITAAEGKIDIDTAAADTFGLEVGEWFYDIKIVTAAPETFYLVEGRMTIDESVSA
jgi:hypothetical protein